MNPHHITFELSKTFPSKTLGQVKRLFYKRHTIEHKGIRPVSLILNPLITEGDAIADDIYFAIYAKQKLSPQARYYVKLIKNYKSIFGPHLATLNIQIYPGKLVWLGTCQYNGNFFDEKEVHKFLKRAIRLKLYYASPKSEEEVIEFDEPEVKNEIIY